MFVHFFSPYPLSLSLHCAFHDSRLIWCSSNTKRINTADLYWRNRAFFSLFLGSVWRSRGFEWNANRPISKSRLHESARDGVSDVVSRLLGYRILLAPSQHNNTTVLYLDDRSMRNKQGDSDPPTRRQNGDGKLRLVCTTVSIAGSRTTDARAKSTHTQANAAAAASTRITNTIGCNKLSVGEFFMTLSLSFSLCYLFSFWRVFLDTLYIAYRSCGQGRHWTSSSFKGIFL